MTSTMPAADECYPYGIFSTVGSGPRVGVRAGDFVLDLHAALGDESFLAPTLNGFMARGPQAWAATAAAVAELLGSGGAGLGPAALVPIAEVTLHLPIEVADFVDFYSGLEHAMNAGRILRPDQPPLKPNWREIPVGYHGHAGTFVVSGTDIVRPAGQIAVPGGRPRLTPTNRLDAEVEMGFIVGVGSRTGTRVDLADAAEHLFGAVILIDWSARDIQAFEYEPLGPLLGKSFGTTISPWVLPLAALDAARVDGPAQEPEPLPYLRQANPRSYAIELEFAINGQVLTRPQFAPMYWSAAQQLAHVTVTGASVRTGDVFGSGTISGFDVAEQGSLLELSWGATRKVELADGSWRHYLEDGDEVRVGAVARAADGRALNFGAATGRILPAQPLPS
jgi:fumarylacetoacetase